jgi:hypothetical protein
VVKKSQVQAKKTCKHNEGMVAMSAKMSKAENAKLLNCRSQRVKKSSKSEFFFTFEALFNPFLVLFFHIVWRISRKYRLPYSNLTLVAREPYTVERLCVQQIEKIVTFYT